MAKVRKPKKGPEAVKCAVCGATNPPNVQFCESCGVEIAAATAQEAPPEIDRLLEELVEIKPDETTIGEKEALDLDKEIVDELLDSLMVEEEPGRLFECPVCNTKLPIEATKCTKCGAEFEKGPAPPPAAPAPAARRPAPTKVETEAVPVTVTDEDVPTLRRLSGRLIDIVVLGTIVALLLIFVAFRIYSWDAIAENAWGLVIFGVVALAGMVAGFLLFRISTGAVAQGDRLVKEGRYDDALYYYDRAIRTASRPASAWTSKGVALKRLGRLDDAMKCHNMALRLDPENEIALCNKGDIYFRARNMTKAIECYDKAIKVRPKYAIAWNNKGAALARMDRFEEARRCHDQAVKLRPKYVAAWLNRGEVLARLGLRDEAQECLEKARALGA